MGAPLLYACGGIVDPGDRANAEGGNDNSLPFHQGPLEQDAATASDATSNSRPEGGPSRGTAPSATDPGSPASNDCSCSAAADGGISVRHPDGNLSLYSLPPTMSIAPSDSTVCSPITEPAGILTNCGTRFLLGACNEDGGCVEISVAGDRVVMNLWEPDGDSVTAMTSSEWREVRQATNKRYSGQLSIFDKSGRVHEVEYSICDLSSTDTEHCSP